MQRKTGLISEFKEFINRGNVMDLAVGVIIGGAFTSIVTALTSNIINPLISLITGGDPATAFTGLIIPGTAIDFGAFIGAVINFLIVAFVVFMLVKTVNKMQSAGSAILSKGKSGETVRTTAPTCPFCLEEVKPGATRCPHCTGAFESPAEAVVEVVKA